MKRQPAPLSSVSVKLSGCIMVVVAGSPVGRSKGTTDPAPINSCIFHGRHQHTSERTQLLQAIATLQEQQVQSLLLEEDHQRQRLSLEVQSVWMEEYGPAPYLSCDPGQFRPHAPPMHCNRRSALGRLPVSLESGRQRWGCTWDALVFPG